MNTQQAYDILTSASMYLAAIGDYDAQSIVLDIKCSIYCKNPDVSQWDDVIQLNKINYWHLYVNREAYALLEKMDGNTEGTAGASSRTA